MFDSARGKNAIRDSCGQQRQPRVAVLREKPATPTQAYHRAGDARLTQEKLQGIARKSSIRREGLREGGREPIFSEAFRRSASNKVIIDEAASP